MNKTKNLQNLADSLSEMNHGEKLSVIHEKKICIQCKKKVDSFEDDESRVGYEIMGLCSICQKELLF